MGPRTGAARPAGEKGQEGLSATRNASHGRTWRYFDAVVVTAAAIVVVLALFDAGATGPVVRHESTTPT